MKIAIATTSGYEAVQFRKLIYEKYQIEDADEDRREGMFRAVYSTKESEWSEILKMFRMIEVITGINPYTSKVSIKSKGQRQKRAKVIAAVILNQKYEMNYSKTAKILGYKCHASVSEVIKDVVITDIKSLPTELVIRKVIRAIIDV